jgi:hypothetical protein
MHVIFVIFRNNSNGFGEIFAMVPMWVLVHPGPLPKRLPHLVEGITGRRGHTRWVD